MATGTIKKAIWFKYCETFTGTANLTIQWGQMYYGRVTVNLSHTPTIVPVITGATPSGGTFFPIIEVQPSDTSLILMLIRGTSATNCPYKITVYYS